MIAVNDNLTAAEFASGVEPGPRFVAFPMSARTVFYDLVVRGRAFVLKRAGRTLIYPEMRSAPGPCLGMVHAAASPHFLCPPHSYAPPAPAAPRTPRRGAHLRVV